MTVEERLQMTLGAKDFAISALQAQLEQAQEEIAKLKEQMSLIAPHPATGLQRRSSGKDR